MGTVNSQGIRSLWKGFALILLLISLFVAYLLVKPGKPDSVTLVDNLIQGIFEVVALLFTLPLFLPKSQRTRKLPCGGQIAARSPQSWVPLLFGLGILCYVIGQALWTYNEDIAHLAVLFPTWADAGYLGSYPFVLLALLLLPTRLLLTETRIRITLDSLLIMVGVFTLGWYFILGPATLSGADTIAGRIVGTAYPFVTLVLIFCLFLLVAHSRDRIARPVVLILSLALLVIVVTDSIYDYQELHNLYATGSLLDVGWPLGYMLVGLAARAIRLHLVTGSPDTAPTAHLALKIDKSPSFWGSMLPYLFVPAVVCLLAYTEYIGNTGGVQVGVRIGTAILLILLILRQIFSIRETTIQNTLLRLMQQDVSAKNAALNEANARLEEQARQIEEAYQQELRLNELKDQFLLHINHELRTPLTTMQGYLELLRLGSADLPSREGKFLQNALESSEELTLLVNNALDVASISVGQTAHCEELSVAVLVQNVLEQLDPRRATSYQIHTNIAKGVVVWADQQFLRQILRNLLSNIFKYVPEGTTIEIIAAPYRQLTYEQDALPRVCFCVKDMGPGIPPKELSQLFEKFGRLNRDRSGPVSGSGLGLFICKQLVELMGGKIWVESSGIEGEGSRFCFTLLAAAPPEQSAA